MSKMILTKFIYARDLNEPKYKILIKKRKDVGIKHLNDHLLSVQIQCITFMRLFMIMIQVKKEKP